MDTTYDTSIAIAARSHLRFEIHGLKIAIACALPDLLDAISESLGEFAVGAFVQKHSPISGIARPYDRAEVLRTLSPTATRIESQDQLVELYAENERFWLIDDRWGLCEINLLKGQWRSWILPGTTLDPIDLVERAVLWPAAQLLRPRGLSLLPAASVVRDGWAVMLVSTFGIEPELTTLVRAGYRIIGQRWTAIREESGRATMLWMPGAVQRFEHAKPGRSMLDGEFQRIDLTRESPGSRCERAACDAVMLIAPGRRPLPYIHSVTPTNALSALRRGWPIAELHPSRRQGQLPARLAQRARVFDVQLSRNPKDILSLLETARYHRPQTPRVTVLAGGERERVVA